MYILSLCEDYRVLSVIYLIKTVIKIVSVFVPIILIVSLVIKYTSDVLKGDGKNQVLGKDVINKIMAAIIIFLVPTIVNMLISIIGFNSENNCYLNANRDYINSLKEKHDEDKKNDYDDIIKDNDKAKDDLINSGNNKPNNTGNNGNSSTGNNTGNNTGNDSSNGNGNNGNSGNNNSSNSGNNNVSGVMEVHFINVGREDAIVIRSNNKVIFIDGGSYSNKSKITPYLQALGVSRIDVMIGSHLHFNHIQAQADLLDNFDVGTIYYPQDLESCLSATYCDSDDQKYILDSIKRHNKSYNIMKINDRISVGDMSILCVGPSDFQTKSQNIYRQNYNSLNFIVTYGSTKFMFTGDHMQSSNLTRNFDANTLNVDVLKYPHHGYDSLTNALMDAMSPEYVVVTSNSGQMQSSTEEAHLRNIGASIYFSGTSGNIVVTSNGKDLKIDTGANASNYKR